MERFALKKTIFCVIAVIICSGVALEVPIDEDGQLDRFDFEITTKSSIIQHRIDFSVQSLDREGVQEVEQVKVTDYRIFFKFFPNFCPRETDLGNCKVNVMIDPDFHQNVKSPSVHQKQMATNSLMMSVAQSLAPEPVSCTSEPLLPSNSVISSLDPKLQKNFSYRSLRASFTKSIFMVALILFGLKVTFSPASHENTIITILVTVIRIIRILFRMAVHNWWLLIITCSWLWPLLYRGSSNSMNPGSTSTDLVIEDLISSNEEVFCSSEANGYNCDLLLSSHIFCNTCSIVSEEWIYNTFYLKIGLDADSKWIKVSSVYDVHTVGESKLKLLQLPRPSSGNLSIFLMEEQYEKVVATGPSDHWKLEDKVEKSGRGYEFTAALFIYIASSIFLLGMLMNMISYMCEMQIRIQHMHVLLMMLDRD